MTTVTPFPTQGAHLRVFDGDRDLDTEGCVENAMSSIGQVRKIRPCVIPTELPSHDFLVRQYAAAAKHRRDQLNRMPPMIDGFDLYGIVLGETEEAFHGGLYDWSLCDDGSLAVMCGCAEARGLVAAFTATLLLASFRSHVCYPHSSSEMVSRLNQSLWIGSTGDQFARLWYGNFCPQSGDVRFSVSGPAQMLVVRGGELRWIVERDSTVLGIDPDAHFSTRQLHLAHGEDLIVLTTQSGALSCDQMNLIDSVVQRSQGSSSAELIGKITDVLYSSSGTAEAQDSSVVVIHRGLP